MDLLPIENKIYEIRGYKVMLDFDYLVANCDQLPNSYGKKILSTVSTKLYRMKTGIAGLRGGTQMTRMTQIFTDNVENEKHNNENS